MLFAVSMMTGMSWKSRSPRRRDSNRRPLWSGSIQSSSSRSGLPCTIESQADATFAAVRISQPVSRSE